MMQGEPLSATLPEDSGLGERFWYWRGASGRRYIHSIYRRDLCPPVPGAVFVIVSLRGGMRRATSVGRFPSETAVANAIPKADFSDEEEIHVHLLAREEEAAEQVLGDLQAAMNITAPAVRPEPRPMMRPVQLELLAA
jgi:hypothetical protein